MSQRDPTIPGSDTSPPVLLTVAERLRAVVPLLRTHSLSANSGASKDLQFLLDAAATAIDCCGRCGDAGHQGQVGVLVTNRIRRTDGKDVLTGRKRATWFCETCRAEKGTGTWKAHDGEDGSWCYECSQHGIKSALRTISVDETRFERGTVEVLCCGAWLMCDGFTNTCSQCGQDYNFAGQSLAPRECWGEETGECVADLLRLDGDLG